MYDPNKLFYKTLNNTGDVEEKEEEKTDQDHGIQREMPWEVAAQQMQQQSPEQEEQMVEQDDEAEFEERKEALKALYDEEYAERDELGNIQYDENGEVIRRDLTSWEKMGNSMIGMVDRMQQLAPNVQITASTLAKKLLGKNEYEAINTLADAGIYGLYGKMAGTLLETDKELIESIQEKELIQEEAAQRGGTGEFTRAYDPETGEINIGEAAAATVNAVSSFVPSIVMGMATGGLSTGAEFYGDMYVDYNKGVAEREDTTLDELIKEGKDSVTAPAAFAGLATASELLGFKGAGNAIKNAAKGPISKKLANYMLAGNKEGLTELFQTGIEAGNAELGKTGKADKSGEAMIDAVTSREGLESYLQGFVGGAGFSGAGGTTKEDVSKLKKAASVLRTTTDAETIDKGLAKRVQLVQALKDTQDPDLVKNYNRQIKDIDNMIKSSVVEANGIARKMTPKQLKDVSTKADAIDALRQQQGKLREKQEGGEITMDEYNLAVQGLSADYKAALNRINDIKAEAQTQPNLRNKDGSDNATGVWNIATKHEIDEVANKAIDSGKPIEAFDIIQKPSVQKFVTSKVRAAWQKLPTDVQDRTSFEDVVAGTLYGSGSRGSQSVLGLINSFKPEGGAKLSSYILGSIDKKITDVIKTETQQQTEGRSGGQETVITPVTEEGERGFDLADEDIVNVEEGDTVQEVVEKTGEEVAARMGIDPKIINDAGKSAELALSTGQFPDPGSKKFEKEATNFFRKQLTPKLQKAFGKKQDYENFLANNWEQLFKTLPKRSLAKRQDESRAWAETPPTQQEFMDYFLQPIKESTGEVSPQKITQRKKALAELVGETLGLKAAKGVLAASPEVQQRFQEGVQEQRVEQADKLQKELDGNWYDTFTSDKDEADFAEQEKNTDKVLQDKGLGKTINTKDPQQLQEGKDWIANEMTKWFPKEFFQQGMFANAGRDGWKRGFFFDSKAEVDAIAEGAQSDPNSVWTKNGRYHYGKKSFDAIKKDWDKIQANNEANWAAFTEMWQTFDKMVQDNPENARFISAFLKGAQNSQNHISRTAAPLKAFSKEDGGHPRREEEHTMPQSAVSRYLMQTILNPGIGNKSRLNKALENVQRNFFQVALNKDDDNKLKKAGEYNYASKMPEGWKPSDNSWARYFNTNVNGNNGGIDPNGIVFFDNGQTVAERFGAATSAPKTADVKQAQQEVVAEEVGDKFESLIDRTISALDKLLGDRGALHAGFHHVPVNILIGGLRATKAAYRGSRDLVAAINSGYNKVKDWMSRDEWQEFTDKAVNEVKGEQSAAQKFLATASENAIKQEQERKQIFDKAKKLGADVKPEATTQDLLDAIQRKVDETEFARQESDQVGQEFDQMFANKKINWANKAFNKYFIGSSAEDFKGLMYRLLPEGNAPVQWFENNLLNPYIEGVEKFKSFKHTNNRIFRKAAKQFGTDNLLAADVDKLKSGEGLTQAESNLVNELKKIDFGKFWNGVNAETDLASQLVTHLNKAKRKQYLEDFINNSKAVFRDDKGKIKREIVDKLGGDYAEALDNMLDRMISGTNRQRYEKGNEAAQKVLDFINEANSLTMHFNMRSAALQMLSSLNYVRASGTSIFDFKGNAQAVNTILNSKYLKERFGNKGFQLEASEIIDSKKTSKAGIIYKKLLNAGFTPTAAVDALAIAVGGAPLYNKYLKEHGDPDIAMREFVKFTEENQQSSDPSKISALQAGTLGRLVFAFLNTPFQYARLTKRAMQDIANRRGSMPDNMSKIAYYTFLQSAAFSMLQNLLSTGDVVGWLDDEEDEEDKKVQQAIDSFITSNLKTMGSHGAFAAWALDIYREYEAQASGDKRVNQAELVLSALKFSPPVSTKARNIKEAGRYLWRQNRGTDRGKLEALAAVGEVVNLPTKRYLSKVDNILAAMDEDKEAAERLLRGLGWSKWLFEERKKKKSDQDAFGLGEDVFDSNQNLFEDDQSVFNTPTKKLDGHELGQAHKDGTIEVDPNLKGEEREIVIAHEKQHQKDFKSGRLSYTDADLTWEGKKYPRKNGKIQYNGKWLQEGDPSFPWEKVAYAAEKRATPTKSLRELYG